MLYRKILSVLRGKFYRLWYGVFNRKILIGKNVRIGKNVILSARNGGKVIIGDNVVVDSNSIVSALNSATISIGNNVGIGSSNNIISHNRISIGNGTLLAPNVNIYDHDHVFDLGGVKRREYITGEIAIGTNCWICINSVILRNTQIGDNCLVAAGSVIKGAYNDNSKIVQKRITEIR